MPRWKDYGYPVSLGLTLILVAYLGNRVQQMEARLDGLESAQSEQTTPSASKVARRSASPRAIRQVVSTASAGGAVSAGAAEVSSIDDHLWSEDGREAIGDVVEAREEADRERRTERWKKVAEYRTQQAVETVAERLALSDKDAEDFTALVDTYMEVRSRRWRQMSDDEDLGIAEIEREYEASREEVEQDLVAIIGDEGLEMLQEEMRKGWR